MRHPYVLVFFLMTSALVLSGCSAEPIPSSANTPQAASVISLERDRQRVIRYDCAGKVTSDKVEDVRSPIEYMKLSPKYNRSPILTSNFRNLTTDDGPDLIIGDTKFNINYDSGLYMRVHKGINEIHYRFTFSDGTIEEDSRYINIQYSVVTLTGSLEKRPTIEQCAKP